MLSFKKRVVVVCSLCLVIAGISYAGENMWTTNGPYGARTWAIRVHPWDRDILYAATMDEGIFKTTNGGESWKKLNAGLGALDLAIDFSNPDRIYVAEDIGIERSLDGGKSWRRIYGFGWFFKWLEMNPLNPRDIIAGGSATATVRTRDGGDSWHPIEYSYYFNLSNRSARFDPGDTSVIYVGTDINPWEEYGGLYKSVDGGQSWVDITNGIDGLISIEEIEVDPTDSDKIYIGGYSKAIAGQEFPANRTVYRSIDGGESWECINHGMKTVGVEDLAIVPHNPRVIYAGTHDRGVWKSTDGGESWQQVNNGLRNVMVRVLTYDEVKDVIYVGTYYGGIYKSTNGGESWIEISQGVTGAWIDHVSINPLNPRTIYASGFGNLFKSTDGAETWHRLGGGIPDTTLIFNVAIDPIDTNIVYLSTSYYGFGMVQFLFASGFYKSTDGGETWVNKSQGLPSNKHIGDIECYADGSIHRLYVTMGWEGVYMSEDGGENWNPRNNGIKGGYAGSLTLDPVEPDVLYLSIWLSGIYKSTDGGEHWYRRMEGLDRKAESYGLVIDPNVHQRLYAISSTSSEAVYVTEYSGWYWWPTGWEIPVPDYEPGALVINPLNSDNLIHVAKWHGVWISYDRGQSWQEMNEGWSPQRSYGLAIDPVNGNKYFAWSSGHSLYTYTKTDVGVYEEGEAVQPDDFSLGQNCPNPFNPTTSIQYSVMSDQFPSHVTLKIYNVLGQEVRTLVDETTEPGFYTVTWDGRDSFGNGVASGVYFYRLTAGEFSQTR
ncbi:MAG: FlgD immunoglobulin-like domain containing protein, partial [Candidatus Zixiibacteriota bacterium]